VAKAVVKPPRAQYEHFESLDYEVCDNVVFKAHEASESAHGRILYRSTKYGICAAVGVIVAFTAFIVNFGVENIAGLRFWLTFKAVEMHSYFLAWLVLTACQARQSRTSPAAPFRPHRRTRLSAACLAAPMHAASRLSSRLWP